MTPNDRSLLARLSQFVGKPWRNQFRSFGFRWLRIFPAIPLPLRLPFGAWWLVRNDQIGGTLLDGAFENTERHFVERFLRPGMTVLDIGANQGYYTLLSSRKVGPKGRVLAFEPSPREKNRLKLHVRMNGCKNVEIFSCALGVVAEVGQLHVVEGSESGCNSLRPPDVKQPTRQVPVRIERLDDVLNGRGLESVDFIKLDVEGAELSVLQGAEQLLTRSRRPVILAEVQDQRTRQWGYAAKEIISFLVGKGYRWFSLTDDGTTVPLDIRVETFDGNFVAYPDESEPLPNR